VICKSGSGSRGDKKRNWVFKEKKKSGNGGKGKPEKEKAGYGKLDIHGRGSHSRMKRQSWKVWRKGESTVRKRGGVGRCLRVQFQKGKKELFEKSPRGKNFWGEPSMKGEIAPRHLEEESNVFGESRGSGLQSRMEGASEKDDGGGGHLAGKKNLLY